MVQRPEQHHFPEPAATQQHGRSSSWNPGFPRVPPVPSSQGCDLTCSSPKRPPRRAQGSASSLGKSGAVMLWHPGGNRRQTHTR